MKAKSPIIIRVLALLLLVLFFVPTSTVSCNISYESDSLTYRANISPFGAATGNISVDCNDPEEDTSEYTENIEPAPYFFAMAALSLVVIIIGNKLPILGIITTIANDVLLFILHIGVKNHVTTEYEGTPGIQIETTFWFFVYLIVSISIIGLLIYYLLPKELLSTLPTFNIPSYDTPPSSDATSVCPHCNTPVETESEFCGYCGKKLEWKETPSQPPLDINVPPIDTIPPVNPVTPPPVSSGRTICPNCKREVSSGTVFCVCGTKISSSRPIETPPRPPKPPVEPPKNPGTDKPKTPTMGFHKSDDLD